MINRLLCFILVAIIGVSCSKETTQTPTNEIFKTESSGAKNGLLDAKYTCDGSSISPPISWGAVPVGTKSFAITMHHIPPTGDKHVYYLVYNVPATLTGLSENNTSIGAFGINTVNGKNSYTPPCSQGPGPKIYVITVYALSAQPVINVAASKVTMDVLTEAMANITLSKSELSVTYSRP